MRFQPLGLDGAWVIEPEPIRDARGAFARTFCAREYAALGLETQFVQHSRSCSVQHGTVRGMHFQCPPHAEVKVVRCIRGALWDVVIDLRDGSPTYGRWQGIELSAHNGRQLYVPRGFAHGFQTLQPDTEALYLISAFHRPDAARGVRFDDPRFGIAWPLPVSAISERDRAWPLVS